MYWNLQVTDAVLEAMGVRCALLVDLNVSGCKGLTDVGMHHLASGVPRFTHLNLTRCAPCPLVLRAGVSGRVRGEPPLCVSVWLHRCVAHTRSARGSRRCPKVTDDGLLAVIHANPQLQVGDPQRVVHAGRFTHTRVDHSHADRFTHRI